MRLRFDNQVKKAGGVRAWARAHDLSHSQVSRAAAGDIPVPPLVLAALGLRRVVTYQQISTEEQSEHPRTIAESPLRLVANATHR